ncbi:MAG TPA: ribosome small subunit-dependent GTPase A [Streptosporangiaceae bacterium]|nr:ribosome small subunit-dependent GTPase A [Streptosporangiaceae bacterium]
MASDAGGAGCAGGTGAGALSRGYDRLDEDDVRVRPGRGSRPRTRTRPSHDTALPAFVTTVDRGRYGCVTDSGQLIVAMKARELGRGSVVVGDRVALAGDVSGGPGTLARIVRIVERTSALRRSADDTDPVERVIVANADQMVIVCALASPEPRLRFVDRCLVAAYDAGLTPILVLTKADLAAPRAVRRVYAPLGVSVIVSRKPLPSRTLSSLRSALAGRVSVLIGQSGVGKSTLVNALMPEAVRATGAVNPVTGRGRHTSSSAVAFPLVARGKPPGWLIDTPGLRGFGLGHVSADRVVEAFGDLDPAGCPPGCAHVVVSSDGALAGPEGCALDEWAREHHAEARLDSLRRLLASREGTSHD